MNKKQKKIFFCVCMIFFLFLIVTIYLLKQKSPYEYLKEQKGHLCDLLQLIMTRIGEDGLEKFNDNEGRFLDWPSCENPLYTKSFH